MKVTITLTVDSEYKEEAMKILKKQKTTVSAYVNECFKMLIRKSKDGGKNETD
jgi:antitoxin component of RelBE/YafQ-DinJ toxin-antitoxin module